MCLSPNQHLDNSSVETGTMDVFGADTQKLSSSEFQRTCYYLRKVELEEDLTNAWYSDGQPMDDQVVIELLKKSSELQNPTWAQLNFFAKFLNEQLVACEVNFFANYFEGFKNFLIRHCLIRMARDFALPSLNIADDSPQFGLSERRGNYDVHQIEKRWENSPHPYVFFNADKISFTFLGVRVENSNLLDLRRNVLASNVMSLRLEREIISQNIEGGNLLNEDFDSLTYDQKLAKLCRVIGVDENQIELDRTYELTQDNVMKLLATYMRFRCKIPVILMGETGCGKTRLIEFLCQLMAGGKEVQNKKIVKVHGGVTIDDIVKNIADAEILALENRQLFGEDFYTVLFFDEANTTEAIYGIKEVICDNSVNGRKIDPESGLKVIVACNPYRKHDPEMIKKLENQGLGYHIKSSETREKLDDIPLRHLVYRVNPLPPSILPLVWDFGTLTPAVENKYIKQIATKTGISIGLTDVDIDFIQNILSLSQSFLRANTSQCLFVSLRDIERAMTVFLFFHAKRGFFLEQMDNIELPDEKTQNETNISDIAKLMILTVGVCYYFSLEDRENYRQHILPAFNGPYELPDGEKTISNQLNRCMQVFLQNITLDPNANIAINSALTENVFMMIICIELRIPLFLVGKPGSSKSLAKTIVIDAMQGETSRTLFFQRLKQVQTLSFQCSPHTRAEAILSTFKQAAFYQRGQNPDKFTSVVVLDKIGLAEDSKQMPLKALHPLLESGYMDSTMESSDYERVGFVGISNWALDPAKMNRGILVNRTIPEKEELLNSAYGICRVDKEGKVLEPLIRPLAIAYEKIYSDQIHDKKAEYFGLRDFYGLLKMLYREITYKNRNHRGTPRPLAIREAIQRNFGGKTNETVKIFEEELEKHGQYSDMEDTEFVQTMVLVHRNMQEVNLRPNLTEEQRKMNNESRYLLLMMESFSALQLLPQVLEIEDYEVIFGSSFPQDQEYIQVCKNINRIKLCMESGKTVILLNLGLLYESLYDALNQYYVYCGGKRFVDLGLGTNRVKCSVSENFRLVIVEEEKTAKLFPIPLLNRLEKHYLSMKSILSKKLIKLKSDLKLKMQEFAHVPRSDRRSTNFHIRDAFVGYDDDTTACVLSQLAKNNQRNDDTQILESAMVKLIQICPIDAIIRAESNFGDFSLTGLKEIYIEQGRKNLREFLLRQCYQNKTQSRLIEVSTFCGIPSATDIKNCNMTLMGEIEAPASHDRHLVVNLNSFKTELEFIERVTGFHQIAKEQASNLTKILFVTCSKGHNFIQLMASAKNRLQNLQLSAKIDHLFTLFIVELPRNWYDWRYSSFSVGQWDSFHVDDLLRDESYQFLTEVAIIQGDKRLGDILATTSDECSKFQRRLLRQAVHEAIADAPFGAKVHRIGNVYRLFEEEFEPNLEAKFLEKIQTFIEGSPENAPLSEWAKVKAASWQDLIKSGTLENALFTDLMAKIKPHVAEFLKLIDFNRNIKLLFQSNWRKNAWIQLFSLRVICRQRPQELTKDKFESQFPFSTEVREIMSNTWDNCSENNRDSPVEDWKYFLERFEHQEPELASSLRTISAEPGAVDSFINDLAMNEVLVALNEKVIKKTVELISYSVKQIVMHNFSTNALTITHTFALYMKLRDPLHRVMPIFDIIGTGLQLSEPPESCDSFALLVERAALSKVLNMAKNLKPAIINQKTITELNRQVTTLKTYSDVENQTEDFKFTLQKLCVLSTYISQIAFNLNDDMAKAACTASDTLFLAMNSKNAEAILGNSKFLNRLVYCLDKSTDAVILLCVQIETGSKLCGFCNIQVTGRGRIPYFVPHGTRDGIQGHVVHKDCLNGAKERARSNEEIICNICQDKITSENLDASVEFRCTNEANQRQWNFFWENISNVFLGVVRDHLLLSPDDDVIKKLAEYSLVHHDNDEKTWITVRLKQGLLTLLATAGHSQALANAIVEVFDAENETEANKIDQKSTLDLLLFVFEYLYNHRKVEFRVDVQDNLNFVEELQLIAKAKMYTRRFVKNYSMSSDQQQTEPAVDSGQDLQFILKIAGKGGIASNLLKLYFIQCVCKEHGMDLYQRMKADPDLLPLMPQILIDSQNHGFSDIFLLVNDEYQKLFCQIYESLATDSDAVVQKLRQMGDGLLQRLVAYRLIVEIESLPGNFAQLRNTILQDELIGGLKDRFINDSSDQTAHRCEQLTIYLFLLNTFWKLRDSCGLMEPFRCILTSDSKIEELYLPTFPDSFERKVRTVNEAIDGFTTWAQCKNGHFYLIGDCGRGNESSKCPDCGHPIGGVRENVLLADNQIVGLRGQQIDPVVANEVRGYLTGDILSSLDRPMLNEFNGNLMQFFLHAVLYISTGEEEMCNKLKLNLENLATRSLNCSNEDTLKFLVSLLLHTSEQKLAGSFNDETQRELWEKAFIDSVKVVHEDFSNIIERYNESFERDTRNQSNSLLQVLNDQPKEQVNCDKFLENPWFWRRTPQVSLDAVKSQVNTACESMQLLKCIFREQYWLTMVSQIPQLFEFFNFMIRFYDPDQSHDIQRFDQFILQNKISKEDKYRMENAAKKYCKLWNKDIRKLPTAGGLYCTYKGTLSTTSPVKYFLPNRHTSDCCAIVTLNYLISKNNQFIYSYRAALEIETR